jgi:hypothetical protein
MTAPRRSPSKRFLVCLSLLFGVVALPANAIDMGDASVLSMQGQRLRVAVPYGSVPGQRVPVMSISVASVEVPEGHTVPAAAAFVISKPEHRNVIFLQSREAVTAPNLKLVLKVANSDTPQVAYDIAVPPMRWAPTQVADNNPKTSKARHGSSKRKPMAAAAPRSAKAPAKANSLFKPVQ